MKILEATIRYYPAVGGVEEYVQQLSEGLVRRGEQVTVFTSDLARHTGRLLKVTDAPDTFRDVRIKRSYTIPVHCRDYSIMPGIFPAMLREKPDLIHGHCFMSFPMDAARLVARMKRIPFVFNPYFTQLSIPSSLGYFYRRTLGRAAMEADAVVVISEFERRMIEEAGFRTKRFALIPPGIDVEKNNRVTHNIYDRLGIKGRRVVLFVGRIDVNKGIDVLIRAAANLVKDFPDVLFVIAGDDFGCRPSLQRLAEEKKIEKQVLFTGRLSRPDLISAFKNAHIFAFPSLYEAFGIVLIEAMAAGLPVVAGDSTAIPYVVENGRTGLLFPAGNVAALTDALRELLQNDRLRTTLAGEGRRYAVSTYSWQKTIDATHKLYESLLNP